SDRRLYTYRYAELTFVRLLIRRGQWIEAREESRMLHRLAIESGDRLLECLVDLARADLCALSGETDSLLAIVGLGSHRFVGHLELFAEYERVVATGSRAAGCSAANSHFQRAKRIFAGLRNVPGLLEVKRCLSSETTNGCDQPADDATDFDPMAVVQQVASLMLLDGRPQLLASELIHLLHQTASVDWAVAVARADTGDYERLAACGAVPPELPAEPSKRIDIGTARERHVELLVEPKRDIESIATLNAVMLLLATVHDLERARAEREERLTLWPIEDVPTEGGQAVVSGHMRELMAF